ncbi:hypothetical protein MP228_005404 [Amoeboaphelidium protococcarum]|nr:hypothetical protein MP228_005404 [Amoeboaphelidium protococcarum]
MEKVRVEQDLELLQSEHTPINLRLKTTQRLLLELQLPHSSNKFYNFNALSLFLQCKILNNLYQVNLQFNGTFQKDLCNLAEKVSPFVKNQMLLQQLAAISGDQSQQQEPGGINGLQLSKSNNVNYRHAIQDSDNVVDLKLENTVYMRTSQGFYGCNSDLNSSQEQLVDKLQRVIEPQHEQVYRELVTIVHILQVQLHNEPSSVDSNSINHVVRAAFQDTKYSSFTGLVDILSTILIPYFKSLHKSCDRVMLDCLRFVMQQEPAVFIRVLSRQCLQDGELKSNKYLIEVLTKLIKELNKDYYNDVLQNVSDALIKGGDEKLTTLLHQILLLMRNNSYGNNNNNGNKEKMLSTSRVIMLKDMLQQKFSQNSKTAHIIQMISQ